MVLRDDLFGQLRDDIYKTVLILRESAKGLADRALLKRNIEDITHQIKTPLTTIQLMLDLIEQDEANQAEYIARLNEEIDRLNRLTSALLKLSSLDAGAITFRNEGFSAESMIYEAIQPIEGLIQQKQVELRLAGQDYEIKGDRSWLMEAFLNLVKNAVEAVDDRELSRSGFQRMTSTRAWRFGIMAPVLQQMICGISLIASSKPKTLKSRGSVLASPWPHREVKGMAAAWK